ncbi:MULTISPECIES: recombinase family protein [Streptomyces]|uniref:recombinase family protein n=1 Tax=Streptomyces TaxID=1883 RepID=UPI0020C70F91|nr:recombinase family protein [Streptomyces sp. GbtcB7]
MTGRDIRSRDEQEKDNRSFVESRGGRYVYTYEEPGTSAWKRKRVRLPNGEIGYRVIRPVFEGALEDLKRGTAPNGERLDGLIVYDIDRLTRDNRHLEDAIEVVENFGRPIIDITGTLDLLTDNGRTVARIVTATNNKQSADTARRVARKHRALQQAGIPTGGTRPFGWKEDKRALDPYEAQWLRQMVDWLLAGKPISAVIRKLKDAGVTTSTGRDWSHAGLKAVMRNPRLCGYRPRQVIDVDPVTGTANTRVEIVLDDRGKPVIGQWEPVISVEEWEAVTELLGSNPAPGQGRNARKSLLRGTLRCDREDCGALLQSPKQRSASTSRRGTSTTRAQAAAAPTEGVGDGPRGVAVTPDGTRVYVTNAISNDVSVIDTATNAVIGTPVAVGNASFGVAIGTVTTRERTPTKLTLKAQKKESKGTLGNDGLTLKAKLTAEGQPLAGKTIDFTTDSTALCTDTTDSKGEAACKDCWTRAPSMTTCATWCGLLWPRRACRSETAVIRSPHGA